MTLVNLPNLFSNREIHPIEQPTLNPYQLGASLYMPATRSVGAMLAVITRQKMPTLNTLILCLEDAVSEQDVPMAMANIAELLGKLATDNSDNRPLVFIRPRHPALLKQLAELPHLEQITGFVLPKVDMLTLADWRLACQSLARDFYLMPTLETASIFNPFHNQELAMALTEAFSQSILALRIGGNDLLACLRLRRAKDVTLYDTPIGALIYQLLGCFVPYGFYLTAPVFEYLDKNDLMLAELRQDVRLGLVGKTIIHPNQLAIVQTAFAVEKGEFEQAQAILHSEAKAVFKHDNSMLEPATHAQWARQILARADVFGVKSP